MKSIRLLSLIAISLLLLWFRFVLSLPVTLPPSCLFVMFQCIEMTFAHELRHFSTAFCLFSRKGHYPTLQNATQQTMRLLVCLLAACTGTPSTVHCSVRPDANQNSCSCTFRSLPRRRTHPRRCRRLHSALQKTIQAPSVSFSHSFTFEKRLFPAFLQQKGHCATRGA